MLRAMVEAPLGDDVLGDDPTVAALEARTAELLGFEAALLTPSGTMANQLAIRSACEAGDEIVAHRDSHIIHYETAAPAALSGCLVQAIEGEGGVFGAAEVRAALRPADQHAPRSRMLVVENTVNRAGGTPWPSDRFAAAAAAARDAGLHVHVDGARLLNACVAEGYEPSELLAGRADSCSICFSKGLGAPVGSAVAGSAAFIARARRFRKMFGGAMRQSGLLAAAALYALDHHVARLVEDHARAIELAQRLAAVEGVSVEPAPRGTRTNMVFLRLPETLAAPHFCEALACEGVRMIPMGANRVRAVTHLDLPHDAVDRVVDAVQAVLAGLSKTAAA
jgi:threonine aldolase